MSESFATPWTVASRAPLSMGFPRQEYQNGLPFHSPGDLLGPGVESVFPVSPALQVDSLPTEPSGIYNFIYNILYMLYTYSL